MSDAPYLDRAEVLFDSKRYDMAIAEYQKYLAQNPNSGTAHGRIAMCLSNLGKQKEALEWCDKALNLTPDDYHLYYLRSFILQKLARFQDATKAIETAIEMEPDIGLYHSEYAACLLNTKKLKEAEKESEIAVQLAPQSEAVWYQRSVVMAGVRKNKEAHEAIDMALVLNPESVRAHSFKGAILVSQNKFRDAVRYYREALRINPTSEWARSGYMEALRGRAPVYKILVFFSEARMPRIWFGNIYIVVAAIVIGLLLAIAAILVKAVSPHLLNVFLAFDPEGQQALDRSERQRAKYLGAYFVASWLCGLVLLPSLLRPWGAPLFLLIYGAPVVVTRIFEFADDEYKRKATIYAGAALTLGLLGVIFGVLAPSAAMDEYSLSYVCVDAASLLTFGFLIMCTFSRQFWKAHASFF